MRWRAPGRINLIGEHTDYNDGFALPLAIAAGCSATVQERTDGRVQAHSVQRGDVVGADLADLGPGGVATWAGYVVGPVWALARRGVATTGLSIEVDSSVPVGSGLSSSAALVCSVTAALDDLLGVGLSPADLLAVTREVENDFVGAPTGGMDQLAALRCTDGHALFCDMRTLATEPVPLPLAEAGLTLLVVDTREAHEHAGGEYRRRREGCERAAALLGVPALRDVDADGLDAALARLPDDELRRYTRHIVTEDDRVLRTVALLRDGRLPEIGALLTESHASMRDDYRITTPALDLAVRVLLESGAFGARMTGGGFGGCAIALVPLDSVAAADAAVRAAFATADLPTPSTFTVPRAARGAHRLD